MKIKKFLMCMMIVFLFISQCFICNNKTTKVSALDELTVKAVEHYDRYASLVKVLEFPGISFKYVTVTFIDIAPVK